MITERSRTLVWHHTVLCAFQFIILLAESLNPSLEDTVVGHTDVRASSLKRSGYSHAWKLGGKCLCFVNPF